MRVWRRGRRRATALLLVLMITGIAVMFIGALISTNQSSIRLASGMQSEKAATANCQSGLDYAWQVLEEDRAAGALPFRDGALVATNGSATRLELRYRNPYSDVNRQWIQGSYLDRPDSGFEIRIWNRLTSEAENRGSDNPLPGSHQGIPMESAMVQVRGYDGKRSRVLEAVLQKAPFVSDAVLAGDNIECNFPNESSQWLVRANDPFRNSIRTKKKFIMNRLTSGSLQFEPTQGTASAFSRYGAVLPGLGVFSTESTELTASELATASSASRGELIARSQQPVKTKTLNADDLKLPTRRIPFKPGVYSFEKTRFDVEVTWQEEVSSTDPITGEPTTTWENRSRTDQIYARAFSRRDREDDAAPAETWLMNASLPSAPSGRGIRGGSVHVQSRQGVQAQVETLQPDGTVVLRGIDGQEAARVNFVQGTFDIPKDTLLTVDGDFVLDHHGLRREDARPKLRLVNGQNPDDPNIVDTAGIKASGDIRIEGGVRGAGALVAGDSLSMYAESTLSASSARPVSLYAENDVTLKKDDQIAPVDVSQAALNTDWTIMKRSIGSESGLDNFLDRDFQGQSSLVAGMLDQVIQVEGGGAPDPDPSYYFASVADAFLGNNAQLRAQAADAFTALKEDGLTLGEAIRFREYTRQLALDATSTSEVYDEATDSWVTVPAPPMADRWLSSSQGVRRDVTRLVQDQLVSYQEQVGVEVVDMVPRHRSMRDWFHAVRTNPYENETRGDSVFRGLVYSKRGNFLLDANHNNLTVVGSLVVPNGKVTFKDASGIVTRYDSKYLRDLLVRVDDGIPVKLDQIYWRLY